MHVDRVHINREWCVTTSVFCDDEPASPPAAAVQLNPFTKSGPLLNKLETLATHAGAQKEPTARYQA